MLNSLHSCLESAESLLAAISRFKLPRIIMSFSSVQATSSRLSSFKLNSLISAFGGRNTDDIRILLLFGKVISSQVDSIPSEYKSVLGCATNFYLK